MTYPESNRAPSETEALVVPPALDDETPSWRTTYLGADTDDRPSNASWGAILVGVAVALAVLVTFSLVAAALGLGIADPTSDQPFDNVGTAVGLAGILALAIALGAGGFVAGVLAVRAGFMHGLAVWATSTLVLVVAVVYAAAGALGVAGSVVGSVGSAIGGGAGTVADVAGDAAGAVADTIGDQLADIDTDEVGEDVQQILADTGVPELQPEYLEDQLGEVQSDLADAALDLVADPGSYDEILDELATSLQERIDAVADSIDREAIAASVEQNTDLDQAEAEQATNDAVDAAEAATEQLSDALDGTQAALDDARESLAQLVDDARETLDDASDAASRAALWAFVGLVIGAAITSFAGLWGSRLVVARTETGQLRTGPQNTAI